MSSWCVSATTCPYYEGAPRDFAIALYSSVVTIEENVPPTAAAPTVSGAVGAWVGPNATVSFMGSDNLGLRSLEVLSGGISKRTKTGVCVDWAVRPCADGPGGGVGLSDATTVSALGLASGAQELRTRATDAAGNVQLSGPTAVNVDVDAPVASGLGGGGASPEAQRTVTWSTPTGGSPIVRTEVRLCMVGGARCETFAPTTNGAFTFAIPSWGTASAVVTMEDAVGNVGTSSPVTLTYDATAPGAPRIEPIQANGGDGARTFRLSSDAADVRTLESKLCSTNTCRELPTTPGPSGDLTVQLPAPGSYRLEVRAVDVAGNVGEPAAVAIEWAQPSVPTPPPNQTPPAPSPVPIIPTPTAPQPTPAPTPVVRTGKLRASFPKRLGRTTLTISGEATPGSARRVTMVLTGRRPTGSSFRVTARTAPKRSGRYSLRIKLPTRFDRRAGLQVEVSARAAPGWTTPRSVRRRLR